MWLYVILFGILAAAAAMDIKKREISNQICAAVLLLLLPACLCRPGVSFADRIAGGLCVSTPMFLISLFRKGAFGGGDIKLTACCGMILGWKITMVSMIFAVLSGGIWGAGLMVLCGKEKVQDFPFGPFLFLGVMAGVLFGDAFLTWFFA